MPKNTSIAVVHDFLYCYSGAERVLEQILNVFPDAALFALFDFLPPGERQFLRGKTARPTFIQRMPGARHQHRAYLPLMPLAIEQLDVTGYDIVISSSYLAAKGVLVRPDQLHICYCHTPVRYAWDLQHQYLTQAGLRGIGIKSALTRLILHYIRNWDVRSANGVDVFVTNSRFISNRVAKTYRRSSVTIYPPVDVERFSPGPEKEDFYVTASRMVPYKRIDLLVEAFRELPDRRLVVVGDGPEFRKIKRAAGPNVELVGHQSLPDLRHYLQRAKAFLFAAEEDFGIVTVEAQACGTPVIAFRRGGVPESVVDGHSGVFFDDQTVASVVDAIRRFERVGVKWCADEMHEHVQAFSAARFRAEFEALVTKEWEAFGESRCDGRPHRRLNGEAMPTPANGQGSLSYAGTNGGGPADPEVPAGLGAVPALSFLAPTLGRRAARPTEQPQPPVAAAN